MKLEAMKRQGSRTDLTLSQNETKSRSDEVLSKQVGESRAQVQRYIRLTELIPELLDLVDSKKLKFTVAVDRRFRGRFPPCRRARRLSSRAGP